MDFDEIIFLRKNKEYGAYRLRKTYKKYLALSMWISILIIVILVTGPIIYKMIASKEQSIVREKVVITELSTPPSIGRKMEQTMEPVSSYGLMEEEENFFYNLSEFKDDTTVSLDQIYSESTLNVSIKYPIGWVYLDQNVKNKLDGITFWSTQGNYEVPPYVHLEVQDKDIFNPARYKNKIEYEGNLFYYNEPEEMEGYFTQIIYVRTETDEDYSFKLMIKGKEAFRSFQLVFFGMVKSLRFGDSFF